MSPHTIPDLDKSKFIIIFECQNFSGGNQLDLIVYINGWTLFLEQVCTANIKEISWFLLRGSSVSIVSLI